MMYILNGHNKQVALIKALSGTKGILPLLTDPTRVESKKTSQIQWPVPSVNAELVWKNLQELP